jgi:hypothetical protein
MLLFIKAPEKNNSSFMVLYEEVVRKGPLDPIGNAYL